MSGLVEQYAAQLGWSVARANVIVEGTTDVVLLGHAATLYARSHSRTILDGDFAIIAAGQGDDGGVHGVNRGLNAIRQVADVDRDASGALRHRFVGLFDNDYAGRNAFNLAPMFDPRIVPFKDIFLLQPIMPSVGDGRLDRRLEATKANIPFFGMDWEVEDLCSGRLFALFEEEHPRAVLQKTAKGSKIHREIERASKSELVRLFVQRGDIEDAKEILTLLRLLRGYLGLSFEYI